jgi:hypothetical protein
VWSAPNYCYRCGNIAAVCEVSDKLQKRFNTFSAAPESERLKDLSNKETPSYFT